MKGYKVFKPDWKCIDFQFEVGKEYKHEGEIEICKSGFHFCGKLRDCFNYYSFDSANKVAEIEASGEILSDSDGKSVCAEIKIVRELSWYEVLELVNVGKNNTGYSNSGRYNSGRYNSGDYNSGDYNSGDSNRGHYNSGDYNRGHSNSGNYNCGDYNSGDYNIGHSNSGSYNSGNYNCGMFNTNEPKMRMFNKDSDMTFSEYYNSDLYIYFGIELTYYENGELKIRTYKEAWAKWWAENNNKEMVERIKRLPNFNAKIFEEITGITIEEEK